MFGDAGQKLRWMPDLAIGRGRAGRARDFLSLSAKFEFHNPDLNKSTTFYKVIWVCDLKVYMEYTSIKHTFMVYTYEVR